MTDIKTMDMEAVEIKTEPLDEDFNQITEAEVIIKSENEIEYSSIEDNLAREPEVQITENWLEPKEEPPAKEPEDSLSPDRTLKEDRLREEIFAALSNHCKFCNMFFKSRTTLKLHERNCQYKNDCRLCSQKFVTSYALSVHLNKQHNRKMEDLSPQKETTKNTLGRPPNIYSDIISDCNLCDICNLNFANLRDLNNHKKKHNTCQQCGEYFKSYDNLKKHHCENVAIKEEDQSETEAESPTKKIFRATNSMVVIPGEKCQTPVRCKAKVRNVNPKKRKSRILFQENSNESSSDNINDNNGTLSTDTFNRNLSPKSGFSVVTRDTDFEAFAQQMMKGFTDISPTFCGKLKEKESISDQILNKLNISKRDSRSSECKQLELVTDASSLPKADPTSDYVIVDSEGNVLKLLKGNFVGLKPALIKDEPLDESEPCEEPATPQMPLPLPFIKDEPDTTDTTDLLLEELFDRKAKSIAKVRETKYPFNPSFEPNRLGFKVKKDIHVQKTFDFERKPNLSSPKRRKKSYDFKNETSPKRKPFPVLPVSRRKALHNKIKEDILENITPDSENKNQKIKKKSKKLSKNKKALTTKKLCTKPLPTEELATKSLPTKKLPVQKKFISYTVIDPTVTNTKLPTLKNTNKSAQIVNGNEYLSKAPAELIKSVEDDESRECTRSDTEQTPKDDKICSEDDVEMVLKEDHTSVKCENMISQSPENNISRTTPAINEQKVDINITSKVDAEAAIPTDFYTNVDSNDSTQNPGIRFKIPLLNDFDFEEMIQSNKLPNFNNVNSVIQNLNEEYKKANDVRLDDVIPQNNINSETQKVLPDVTNTERDKPGSLFFPMLADTQVYNMVANTLNEKYRYIWICPLCPRQYTQDRSFRKHLLSIHYRNPGELEGQTFELRPQLVADAGADENFCHLCHCTLADKASLHKHQIELHKEQDLTISKKKKPLLHRCYICSRLCSSRSLLAEHMKSDCGKNPQYGCNVCDKKFHTKSTLNLHKTMHTGELPHVCRFCQKRFRTRGQLTVHTRTHTGEKPFPCKVCGQCFTHRETLIAHLSRHIDMKRYKCYGCDQFFSCISGLKTHRQVRPETCGRVELNARAVGPRVRVIKGNVIFEPQPIYNARLAKVEKPCLESYVLDHNYCKKENNQPKRAPRQPKPSELITITVE